MATKTPTTSTLTTCSTTLSTTTLDDDDDDDEASRGGGTADQGAGDGRKSATARHGRRRRSAFFGRIGRFVREVVAELRKVIWPTRKELLTYTAVVVVFVAFMMAIVAGLDFVFAKGVLFVFGNPK